MLRTVEYNNLITVGIDNTSDYTASDICENAFSSSFLVNGKNVEISIGSRAFIYNALFAFAVCEKLGMSFDEINTAINNFKLSPHRLDLIKCDKYTIIDDTYNASFDSVKNSLELLSKVENRKVFIFADILELDNFGESIHTNLGNVVSDNKIDVLITVGELSKYTHNVVLEKNNLCYHYNNNQELIDNIDSIIKDDDMILIKGSHGMNLVEIVDYLKK
jgi:UDP-N-acetylmuramoyl-tripeptide--D-alanyl-D-alanine ligase